MNSDLAQTLKDLAKLGWWIETSQTPIPLPDAITARYPWFPAEYRKLVEETMAAVSPSDTAWLLTGRDYSNTSDSAYAWDEWERQSLDAAADDAEWQSRIREFWNTHLPIMLSTKSGYGYLAIEYPTLKIVAGNEPEYEETVDIAESIGGMLRLIATQDHKMDKWT